MIKDIFDAGVVNEIKGRIEQLTPQTMPVWGKMSVDQMLAHCNVTYEMTYEDKHPKPNFFMKFILKNFVKPKVVSHQPYAKSSPTAPAFIMTGAKDFNKEKSRLVEYLERTQDLGRSHFEGKEQASFGKLTADEWNTMFYKHIDHHLSQFGV